MGRGGCACRCSAHTARLHCSPLSPLLPLLLSPSPLSFFPTQTSVVGLVYTQSEIIAREVHLVENLHVIADGILSESAADAAVRAKVKRGNRMVVSGASLLEESMAYLKAIVFIQPNSINLHKLAVLLKSPRYNEYHICE